MNDYIAEYHRKIINGDIIVGQWIRMLYDMIVSGIESGDYIFDKAKASTVIEWIEAHCYHTEGPLAPQPFILALWQKAAVSVIYGIVDKEGKRIFREVLFVMARKNGKSLLASALVRYEWYNGGFGARIYCVAPKLDQTAIIYDSVWQQTLLEPEYQEFKETIRSSIKYHERKTIDDTSLPKHRQTDLFIASENSVVKKLAFSDRKSDGFNPSLCVCDEVAAWEGDKGLKQYEVLKSGMGARPEGILLSCTTSGYVNESIYDELIKRSTRFLLGDSKEKRLLPFLYVIDDLDKWDDMDELRKSSSRSGSPQALSTTLAGSHASEEFCFTQHIFVMNSILRESEPSATAISSWM